nr:tyrosine-protein kinase Srms isoform X3 [Oryctolagus cuniculus]
MEPFLRKRLAFLSSFWDKIWPASEPDEGAGLTPEPPAAEPAPRATPESPARSAAELNDGRGGRPCAPRQDGDYVPAPRLSGQPGSGPVPLAQGAAAAPELHSDQPWFFRGITRTQAQQLLLSPANAPGAFLIRPSESSLGGYSLSVRAKARVCHYRIGRVPGGLYLQEGRLFPSLEALLSYYKANWRLIHNPLLQPCLPQGPSDALGGPGAAWSPAAAMKLTDLAKEMEVLKGLRHERLIRLLAVCSGEPVFIVTELMSRGSLQALLASPEGRALGLPLLLGFACQVAEGMSYLEQQRVVHRDLAARNVLVGDDLSCKVADFGLARLLKDDVYSPSSGSKIPVKWTAPEAAHFRIFSQKSDVWSFGVLLYEVFAYGQCPYEGMTNQETLQQLARGYRLPRPAACPAEVYLLMLGCWRDGPEERPAFALLWEQLATVHRRLLPALA